MTTENNDGASKMKPKVKKVTVKDLEAEVALLNEQLWYTQEALRRFMLAMSEQVGPQGAETINDLITEWTQIIHNINKDHGRI